MSSLRYTEEIPFLEQLFTSAASRSRSSLTLSRHSDVADTIDQLLVIAEANGQEDRVARLNGFKRQLDSIFEGFSLRDPNVKREDIILYKPTFNDAPADPSPQSASSTDEDTPDEAASVDDTLSLETELPIVPFPPLLQDCLPPPPPPPDVQTCNDLSEQPYPPESEMEMPPMPDLPPMSEMSYSPPMSEISYSPPISEMENPPIIRMSRPPMTETMSRLPPMTETMIQPRMNNRRKHRREVIQLRSLIAPTDISSELALGITCGTCRRVFESYSELFSHQGRDHGGQLSHVPSAPRLTSSASTSSSSSSSSSSSPFHVAPVSPPVFKPEPLSPPTGIQEDCPICMDSHDSSDIFSYEACTNGHRYCLLCLSAHLTTQILDAEVEVLQCPHPGCPASPAEYEVRSLVSPDTYEKYLRFVLLAFLQTDTGIIWCPNPACASPLDVTDEGCSVAGCPTCQTSICLKCNKIYHPSVSCEGALKPEEHLFQAWLSEKSILVKPCPECNARIEKNSGCNHITCRCTFQFCWLCGLQFQSGHFDQGSCRGGQFVDFNSVEEWAESRRNAERIVQERAAAERRRRQELMHQRFEETNRRHQAMVEQLSADERQAMQDRLEAARSGTYQEEIIPHEVEDRFFRARMLWQQMQPSVPVATRPSFASSSSPSLPASSSSVPSSSPTPLPQPAVPVASSSSHPISPVSSSSDLIPSPSPVSSSSVPPAAAAAAAVTPSPAVSAPAPTAAASQNVPESSVPLNPVQRGLATRAPVRRWPTVTMTIFRR